MSDTDSSQAINEPPLHELRDQQDMRSSEGHPISIIDAFLKCFDENGTQVFQIPGHVMTALAKRFQYFMDGNAPTLDEAFGNKTGQQRNKVKMAARNGEILFHFLDELERARKIPAKNRNSTPFEIAAENTAEAFDTSADHVKKIYKLSGPKSHQGV
ncbi:MAG: hypothetical protein H3C28_02530 [Sphingomonadales bacterium]|nr:hypothetical protein [Sphingomonadales bacterium]